MATMSFADANKPVDATHEASTTADTTAIVKPTPSLKEELAVATEPTRAAAGIEGEIDNRDIQLPRLNLLQKTSELVDQGFTPNTFTLNKEIPLGKSITAVVVKLTKRYQQDLPFGSETQPHVCDTLAEVREAGGSVEWGSENRYSEIAHMQLLVKAPADATEAMLDAAFPYVVDNEHWAPCMLTVAKTAYKAAAKPVITAGFSTLRGGLHTGLWTVASEIKSGPMGSWSVPQFKLTGRTAPTMAEFVAALQGEG